MLSPAYQWDRRRFLQVGAAGVVASALPGAARFAVAAEPFAGRAKSVLIVLLSGGPSQLDMLDPKPDAPAEIRGEFKTIGTTMLVPGVGGFPYGYAFAVSLLILGWMVARVAHLQESPGLEVPMSYPYAGMVLGGAYLLFVALRRLAGKVWKVVPA